MLAPELEQILQQLYREARKAHYEFISLEPTSVGMTWCRFRMDGSVIPDNTVISKFVIPAQAGIQTPDAAGIYRK
ncbi:hypothetical protein [Neisseria meningitidis]|uniref:hypothetical protein n=1 Tax=Neisseria meningitidis TaxID=487 RepID=UPI0018CBD4F7|nr:hypothetical protein [Neisseria meningitidis]MBG9106842.1 hypothetical protein [Neisseria meningitidis]